MEKLKMHTPDLTEENFRKLAALFPNAVTETTNENGEIVRAIDADVLRQEISAEVVEGRKERYQFTWPDKKKSIVLANAPSTKALRLEREKSVGRDGTEGSIDTENIYIEGDNLDALKLLRETYLGKVKMIYIDPPYNTKTDAFVYDDDFTMSNASFAENSGAVDENGNQMFDLRVNNESNGRFHTDWLNMIYPRLRLARDLLADDGVIFISIDDNEQENLKKICDEIFLAKNFVSMLSVENNPKGRKNSAFISVSSEHCLIFAKNRFKSYFVENVPKESRQMSLDEEGQYVHNSGKRVLVGENNSNKTVTAPNSKKNYSVYFRKIDYSILLRKELYGATDSRLIADGYVKYYSHYNGKLVENTYTEEKFLELFRAKALNFAEDKIYEKNFSDTIRMKNQLINREYEAIVRGEKKKFSMELTTTGAKKYLKELFNMSDVPFTDPKNIGFLKMLISLIDDTNFYILDFFSGSASIADSVMRLNAIDGKNRKFIMVQLPEVTAEKSEARKAGYHTICDIGEERIRRAGKKIKEETGADIDYGFRVLRVDSSNMRDVYYRTQDLKQTEIELLADNIKEDRTPEDLLFQVMLELDILLSSKIEEKDIAGKKVFMVEDNYLIACFDVGVTEEVVTAIAKKNPVYAVFRDSSIASDAVMTNFEQLFKTHSPQTAWKVL